MGSSLSGFLAIIFLDTIERNTLRVFPHCPLFARYVDDCFGLVRNAEDAEELLALLNSQHPAIKFELEKPMNDHSLSLLDFTVNLAGDHPHFTFYRKAAKKNLFIHAQSSLPNTMKVAAIKNETKRICERSTSESDQVNCLKGFKRMLRLNGYSEHAIETHCTSTTRRPRPRRDLPTHYLSFPFISDYTDRKIKRLFRNEGINIRVYHRQKSLRQALKQPSASPNTCRMKNCPLNNRDCLRKMVVYGMGCTCGAYYIGSTIRTLHTRVREHHRMESFAVFKHNRSCGGQFSTQVIVTAKDPVELRLKEAIAISTKRPSLNDRDEGRDICSVIYI